MNTKTNLPCYMVGVFFGVVFMRRCKPVHYLVYGVKPVSSFVSKKNYTQCTEAMVCVFEGNEPALVLYLPFPEDTCLDQIAGVVFFFLCRLQHGAAKERAG